MNNKKWTLISLATIPFIMTLCNSMLLPILPQISRELGISAFQVSMIITVYALVAIPIIPIAGYLSDKYGRKKIILPSLLITALGGAVCVIATWFMEGMGAYWVILSGRLLQGIGAAGAFPIVMPFIGDLYRDEAEVSKNLGLIETTNTFGKVISPILGAFLGTLLWFAPFIAIPVLCLLSFVMVLFLVKKPPAREKTDDKGIRQFANSLRDIFKEHGRWLYSIFIIGVISMFVIFGVLFYLSETLESKYNIHGAMKGFILAIPLSFLSISSFVTGKAIGKNKKLMKWLSLGGMVLLTLSMVMICFTKNVYFMIGFFSLSGIGIGAALPCMDSLITEGFEKEMRGTITSLYSSMRFIGVALGPLIVSLLVEKSHWLLFGIMIAVGVIGGIVALFGIKPDNSKVNS